MQENKKKKLDYRCSNCKRRFSLNELIDLGYAEKVGNVISVNCPSCDNQEILKR